MHIETWPIERLIPYEKNARIIPQAAIDKVAASLKEFGWQQPIVVDNEGVMIVGHVRRLGALQLGWTECPVHVARDLTAKQVKQYRLMDNRSHEEATWDDNLLRFELGELEPLDLGLTGFELPEIDELLGRNAAGLTDEDDVPEVPEHPVSRLGDLWIMGKHRLLCGDSTKQEDVGRLLDGTAPFLMVTDPPYGVDYDPSWRESAAKAGRITARGKFATAYMETDTEAAWKEAHALFPGSVAYVWHATRKAIEVAIALREVGFEIRAQIIWKKQHLVFSRGHYHIFHEPCWYVVRKGHTAHWIGDSKQSTWWEVANLNRNCGNAVDNAQDGKTGHAAQKPVELMRRSIANHESDVVYDPFMGSGTTLIACEKESRLCCGLELGPAHCDVIIRRWQDFTGKTAQLEDGQSFERVSEIRRCEREAERCRTEPGTTPSEQLGAIQGETDWLVAKQMAEES